MTSCSRRAGPARDPGFGDPGAIPSIISQDLDVQRELRQAPCTAKAGDEVVFPAHRRQELLQLRPEHLQLIISLRQAGPLLYLALALAPSVGELLAPSVGELLAPNA